MAINHNVPDDASLSSGGGAGLTSGAVTSGFIGNGAVMSGNIASGQIASGHLASGTILPNYITSGGVQSGMIASGSVQGYFGSTRHIASGTVGVDDLGSGAVVAGSVGSGAIVSGNIASGQVGNFAISSGAVTSGRLGVTGAPDGTKLLRDDFTWVTPGAASITSGSVGSGALASGVITPMANVLVQERMCLASEAISGTRFVVYDYNKNNTSGLPSVHIAQARDPSFLMPSIGLVIDNVVSGDPVKVYLAGEVRNVNVSVSGILTTQGNLIHVGASGEFTLRSPLESNISGCIEQPAGEVIAGSGAACDIVITWPGSMNHSINNVMMASGAILSGNIASGQVGQFHISSGAVTSGRLGVTGTPDGTKVLRDDFVWVAPGTPTITSGSVGSGAIAESSVDGYFGITRRIQSGTVGVYDFGSGAVIAGAVGSGAIRSGNIASGQLGHFTISSGAIQSGQIGSGSVGGQAGDTIHIQSGTIRHFDFGSGAIQSGDIGSGQVGTLHIASGSVTSGRLGVTGLPDGTKLLRDDFTWVTPSALASGSTITYAEYFAGDFYAAEVISGTIAGAILPVAHRHVAGFSGGIVAAQAAASGRFPAIGFIIGSVNSGVTTKVFQAGAIVGSYPLPNIPSLPGSIGAHDVFLGSSFAINGPPNLSTYSGAISQAIGTVMSTSGGRVQLSIRIDESYSGHIFGHEIASGAITSGKLGVAGTPDGTKVLRDDFNWVTVGSVVITSGSVGSGAIASGAVNGFFGPTRNIASGTVGSFDLGSGAVMAGQLGSGAVQSGNIASGAVGPFQIANGAVQSGDIGSGQVGWPHLASGAVRSGHIGDLAIVSGSVNSGVIGWAHLSIASVLSGQIGSGQVGQIAIASGAVTSGRIGVSAGTPDGTLFLRDDFTWSPITASILSGSIGSGDIASGAVQGHAGTTINTASGTFRHFDFGSGAIQSGDIASGQIGPNHFGSGGIVRSGAIGSGAVTGAAGGGAFVIASGTVTTNDLGSGAIVSGLIASGQVGNFHISSGAVTSGRLGVTGTPDGTLFLRDDFTWQPTAGGSLTSGAVQSGHIASGAVTGFFGPTRRIASGTVGSFDLGSGAVMAGQIGSGAVQSGNIASGVIGANALASGIVVTDALRLVEVKFPAFGTVSGGHFVGHVYPTSGVGFDVCVGEVTSLAAAQQVGPFGAGNLVGMAITNGLSGEIVKVVQFGRTIVPQINGALWSGLTGRALYIGPAYDLQITPDTASGVYTMPVATLENTQSGQSIEIMVTMPNIGASGRLMGWFISSGAINSGQLGDNAVASGTIASGVVGHVHIGAEAIQSGQIGSGTVFGQRGLGGGPRNIQSGSIGHFDFGSGAIQSGDIASGQIGPNHLGFIITAASGTVGSGGIASGAVQGHAGTTINTASGTFRHFDFGSGAIQSGDIASGQIGGSNIASGGVTSGHIASGQIGHFHVAANTIQSGQIQMGGVGPPDGTLFFRDDYTWSPITDSILSGAIGSGDVASGAVQGFFGTTRNIASGTVGAFDLGSGAVIAGTIGSGAVVSGNIASGQVGQFHISSGAVTSGRLGVTGTPNGTQVLRDDFTWVAPGTPTITSGSVASGAIASGAVTGFFGATRRIASGTVGSFDFGSGAVTAGTVGSGAIVSGNIASGQVGEKHIASGAIRSGHIASGSVFGNAGGGIFHIASGTLNRFDIGSGGVNSGNIASGQVGEKHIASGAIRSGHIASGSVFGNAGGGIFHIASGTLNKFDLGSGAIISGNIASGVVGTMHIASGGVQSGNIASGQIGSFHLASGSVTSGRIASGSINQFGPGSGTIASGHISSGNVITYSRNTYEDTFIANETISGLVAVAFGSGGTSIVRAQPGSGLRMPAIGISVTNVLSGALCPVVIIGKVMVSWSGGIAGSGVYGICRTAYVGSGGLILNSSGYVTGASSGGGPAQTDTSGRCVQRVGQFISGGLFVQIDPQLTSGFILMQPPGSPNY